MSNASNSNKPQDRGAASGTRSENSSLFSLEALKHQEAEAAQQPKKTDDSGLIDLKALAMMERGASKPNPLDVASVMAPADIFGASSGMPNMAPPPASAVATAPASMAPPPKKANMGIIIGGAVAAVGIAVGAFMAMQGGSPTPAAPSASAVVAAPPPTAATAAAPEEPKVAAVVPGQRQGAPSASAVATTAPGGADKPTPVARVPGPMPKAKAPAADGPAPAPAKPVEACDLGCQMKRAVEKKK